MHSAHVFLYRTERMLLLPLGLSTIYNRCVRASAGEKEGVRWGKDDND